MFRRRIQWIPLLVVLAGLPGCGFYADYVQKYEDALADKDFRDRMNRLLGPTVQLQAKGFQIRLPVQLPIQSLPDDQLAQGVAAIFVTPPEKADPMSAVVLISRKAEQTETLSMDDFVTQSFAPERAEQWMGPGADLSTEIALERRDIKASPTYKTRPARTVPVRWTSVSQTDPSSNLEFVWKVFFLESGNVRGIFGFRVSKDAFSGAVAEAIDLSVTTAELFESASSGSTTDAPTDPAKGETTPEETGETPTKASDAKPAKKRAPPRRE